MPLREAYFSEQATLAKLCSAAFFDEDLFGRVMHPYRHEYPDDVAIFWHRTIRNSWFDWRNRILVAVTPDEQNNGRNKVVGVAVWKRQGEGGKKLGLNWWDIRNILSPLSTFTTTLTSPFYPNRALSRQNANIFARSAHYSAHFWSGPRSENWYLSLLAVEPAYQGRGFGRELVAWGIEEAEKEGVYASVMSSKGTEAFYVSCGLKERVGNACEGEGNPMAEEGVEGVRYILRF